MGIHVSDSALQSVSFIADDDHISSERPKVLRRYTFKLYPSKAQATALTRQAALSAMLWNAALEQRETQWAHEVQRKAKAERKGLSKYEQGKELKFLRAECPEFKGLYSASCELVLDALDNAFKAFFQRAKQGAGASSGYPRYKSVFAIEHKGADCTIWYRNRQSGWKFAPSGKHWRLSTYGVDGSIRARGRFPVAFEDVELRDMRLMRTGREWFISVVVRMEARRAPGQHPASVEFDLIDEFASVKGANGECLPGWGADHQSADERKAPHFQQATSGSPDEGLDLGADGRQAPPACLASCLDEGLDLGADGRVLNTPGKSDDGIDAVQSEGDRRFKKFSYRWKQQKRRVARMRAREARQRKHALHLWTTRLVSSVSELAVICPPIKEHTKSAKGDAKRPGAAVKTVAMLNRHVLAQSPAMAIQMLRYKAEEAGVSFASITPSEHALAVGRDLPAAIKAARKAKRKIKENQHEAV